MSAQLQTPQTKIKVIGLGGGGSNTVARMIEFGVDGVEFIAANTDAQVLRNNPAPVKVLLGPRTTGGQGAGGNPAVGYKAADESREALAAALHGADMVFLTAGMGGGTGTGAIAIAAEVARQQGAVTVSVVTTPFAFEGKRRYKNAVAGLKGLQEHTNTLVVVPNERLLAIAPKNLPLTAAFRLADEVLRRAIQGVTDIVTQTGLINRDFNDVRRMMASGGGALISIGTGKGEDRVAQALRSALHNPLIGNVPLDSATGVLANFVSGDDVTLYEIVGGMQTLHDALPADADVVWGYTTDPNFSGRVQVVLLITGVGGVPVEDFATQQSARPAPAASSTQPQHSAPAPIPNDVELPAFLRRRLRSAAA